MSASPMQPASDIRRIAMVSVHGCPLVTPGMRSAGGMSVYLRHVAPLLAARDICVDIFTRSHQAGGPELLDIGLGVRVIHVPGGSPELAKEQVPPHLPEILRSIRSHVDAEGLGYDLVHSHYWLSGWVGAELAQHLGVPHAITYHTIGLLKEAVFEADEPPERKAAEASMATSADAVLAFTEEESQTLQGYYNLAPQSIHVAPGGVDLDTFRPSPQPEARRRLGLDLEARLLLYIGRLEPFKAPDILVRALAQVPGAKLMIVGGEQGDAGSTWLHQVAQDAGVADRVLWHGAVPQEALPDYYAAADLLVVPSYHESFGLVALEAMACGTPVVAARVGGLQSVIADGATGCLVGSHDPSAYAACISQLLDDDAGRAAMGRAAVVRAATFGWEAAAAGLMSAYQGLVTQAGHRPTVVRCVA